MAQCYDGYNGYYYNCNSSWDNWVRWLVLALVIIAALFIFFLVSCLSARRRRKLGYAPYRGTGWTLGRTPPGHAPATYTGQQYGVQQPYYNNSNNPPPAYASPPNNGYYGNDVELQQPGATYGGYGANNDNVYKPPMGPPPGRS